MRRAYLVHAALFLVATLFSANYIISKLAMASFSPLTFAYLRVAGAAILLQVVMPRDRTPLDRGDSMRLAGFAMLAVVINQTAFLTGLALTSAHVAAILITTIPVFTLAAAIALGRERATAWKVGGIALAAAGALLIVGREGFEGTRGAMIGSLLLVTNCLSYALYLVLSKPMMARQSARRVVSRMFAIAAVVMTPIAIVPLTRQDWSAIPGRAWIGLLLVIAGPTVAAYLLSAWALGHADSSTVAAYTYVQPFLATVLAAIFLGETIRPVILLAALMIFAGVYAAGARETVSSRAKERRDAQVSRR